MAIEDRIKATIRDVPDFPKTGIMFKDITPVLEDPTLSKEVVSAFVERMNGEKTDAVVGVESRGFIFGMMLAQELQVPFIIVRKKGKLPYHTVSYRYDLEYGSAEIEMHTDALRPGSRVLIHDDLLATGGTAAAAAELVQMQGGKVIGFAFLIGLSFLNGTSKLRPYSQNIINLVEY